MKPINIIDCMKRAMANLQRREAQERVVVVTKEQEKLYDRYLPADWRMMVAGRVVVQDVVE